METRYSMIDKAARVIVAAGFVTIAAMLVVVGCTFLPVIGILAALPVMAISLHFLRMAPRVLETGNEERAAYGYREQGNYCSWPPAGAHEGAA